VACLPPELAAFGRARQYLGSGDCPGGAQPVLKRIGAVAGDVVELTDTTAAVNHGEIVRQDVQSDRNEGPDESPTCGQRHAKNR